MISGALRAPLIGAELSFAHRELQASRCALRLSTRSSGNRPNRLQALTRFPATRPIPLSSAPVGIRLRFRRQRMILDEGLSQTPNFGRNLEQWQVGDYR